MDQVMQEREKPQLFTVSNLIHLSEQIEADLLIY